MPASHLRLTTESDAHTSVAAHVWSAATPGSTAQRQIMSTAAGCHAGKFEVGVIRLGPTEDDAAYACRSQAVTMGCPFAGVQLSRRPAGRELRRLAQICQRINAGIWHAHDPVSLRVGRMVSRLWPMRQVHSLHQPIEVESRGWWATRRYRKLMRQADHVLVHQPSLAKIARAIGISEAKTSLITPSIDIRRVDMDADKTRHRYDVGIHPEAFAIGYFGPLDANPAFRPLLKTILALRSRGQAVELHMVGDGPTRDSVSRFAAKLGIENSVHIWGWQSNRARLVPAMDLVVGLSTAAEDFEALLWAMASNVVIAAKPTPDFINLLDHGNAGILLDEYADHWADVLARAVTRPAECRQYHTRGRQRIIDHYEDAGRFEKMGRIYRMLLGQPAGLPAAEEGGDQEVLAA